MLFLHRARSGQQAARRRTAAASAFVVLAALAVSLPQTGSAVAATDPCRQPAVRDVMISQGLPSYGTLARGKTALVKFFLSEPSSSSCANVTSESTSITGGRLLITKAGSSTAQRVLLDVTPSGALPEFSGYEVAPVTATPSDPRFVVPGDLLTSADPVHAASAYGVTFSAELDYVVRSSTGSVVASGTLPVTSKPGGGALTATVSKPVKPLRLLVVPMGNPDVTTPPQFPTAAATEVASGLSAVSRQLPIPDGLGDLKSTAGLRWHLSSGMVDLGPHQEGDAVNGFRTVNYMTTGTFCGGGSSFDYIQKQLSQFRSAWNAENPAEPVDRVLGVVWKDISRGAQTNDGSCAEGYAGLGGSVAWARVLPQNAARLGVTGSLAALELTHGFGGSVQNVTQGSSGPVAGSGFPHSFSKTADATASNRAYNVSERVFLDAGRNRSVMAYDLAPYDDYGTLYEKKDWDFVLCFLTSTSATPSQDCGSPVSAGTSVSAAGGSYVLAGSTDGSAAGTDAHTYFEEDMPRDGTDSASTYRLVQRDAAGAPLTPSTGVRVATVVSEHTHDTGDDVHSGSRAAFDVAIPQRAGAVAFELWKGEPGSAGATLLYRRALAGTAPEFVQTGTRPAPAEPVAYTADGASSEAAVSPDGGLVAFTTKTGVVVARSTSDQPRSNAVAGASAAWNPNGTEIAVVRDGEVFLVPVTAPATGAPVLGAPRKVYGSRLGTGTPPASDPAFAPDGSELALSIAGDLFAVNLRLLTPDAYPVLCPLDAVVQDRTGGTSGLACRRLTSDAAPELEPSWSATYGLIAYQRGQDAVWTLDPAAPGRTQQPRLALEGDTATDPTWAGTRLLAVRNGGLLSVDGQTFGELIAVTDSAGDVSPSASASGSKVLFTRPSGGGTDLFSLGLTKQTATATVKDDTPAQLRMDLYVVCDGTADPLVTGGRPSRVDESAGIAEFDLRYDTSRTCADGVLLYRTTDGYSVTRKDGEPVPGTGAPVAAVYVPKPGAVLLQYDNIPASGAGTSASGRATALLVWTLTGPGVQRSAGTGTTVPDLVPPAGGWSPGTYTLTAVPDGESAAAVSRVFTISGDRDADGIADARDSRDVFPCYPADAVSNAANALADYDLDLLPSIVDPAPCVSAMNGRVVFNPQTLNLVSSGNPITLTLTTAALDVRKLQVGDVSISQVGGFDAAIPALALAVKSPTEVEAKFSRQHFIDYFNARGLLGYVPVVLSASRGGVTARGFDAKAPVYQP